jgi:cysteinyl-tRNA synthetase
MQVDSKKPVEIPMPLSPLGWLYVASVSALFWVAYPYRDRPAEWVEQATNPSPLASARTWRYRRGAIDVDALAADPSDVLVVDVAKTEGGIELTADEVARLKIGPGDRRRIVLAYLSVGEVEEFRSYWDKSWSDATAGAGPAWLDAETCAQSERHPVRYWQEGWKEIAFRGPDSYLRRIVKAGFDGAYVGRLDVYKAYASERPGARRDMIGLVGELAATARRLKPGFLIVPENAEELVAVPEYRRIIDGIGKEGLIYDPSASEKRNDAAAIFWSIARLDKLAKEGKPVFVVEYLTDAAAIDGAALALRRDGYVPAFERPMLAGGDATNPVIMANDTRTPGRSEATCPTGSVR